MSRRYPLATIGYESAPQAKVIETLKAAGVEVLIDVRAVAASRRAGFSKGLLSSSLEDAGIRYVHLRELGTPKEGRIANRAGRMEEFWRIVDEGLARPEAEYELALAGELAASAPSCLLCFEADHRTCHRLEVANRMAGARPFAITHLHPDPGF